MNAIHEMTAISSGRPMTLVPAMLRNGMTLVRFMPSVTTKIVS